MFADEPTHDDIIEAKKVDSQLSFEKCTGNLVLRNLSPSVCFDFIFILIVQSSCFSLVIFFLF